MKTFNEYIAESSIDKFKALHADHQAEVYHHYRAHENGEAGFKEYRSALKKHGLNGSQDLLKHLSKMYDEDPANKPHIEAANKAMDAAKKKRLAAQRSKDSALQKDRNAVGGEAPLSTLR